jgi:hypothetical protein
MFLYVLYTVRIRYQTSCMLQVFCMIGQPKLANAIDQCMAEKSV